MSATIELRIRCTQCREPYNQLTIVHTRPGERSTRTQEILACVTCRSREHLEYQLVVVTRA